MELKDLIGQTFKSRKSGEECRVTDINHHCGSPLVVFKFSDSPTPCWRYASRFDEDFIASELYETPQIPDTFVPPPDAEPVQLDDLPVPEVENPELIPGEIAIDDPYKPFPNRGDFPNTPHA